MTDQPCPRCGQSHDPAKCTGHNARGLPCGKAPMKGQRVCRNHGGSSPQSRAAAERRQVEQAATVAIAELWPGLASQTPIADPMDLLGRTAAALEHMAEKVGARVNELQGRVGAGEHLTQLRAEVVLLDRLLDKLLKATDSMARLGIAERRAEFDAQLAGVIVSAYLEAVGVVSLVPADRDLMLRTFLRSLGLPESETVAGEVAS